MAVEIIWLGPVLAAVVVGFLLLVALRFGASIVWLVINSIIGLIVLTLLNFFPFINITINVWSLLIVVFGGVPGIVLLVLLDLAGIAF